jgi:hypothetical protein
MMFSEERLAPTLITAMVWAGGKPREYSNRF